MKERLRLRKEMKKPKRKCFSKKVAVFFAKKLGISIMPIMACQDIVRCKVYLGRKGLGISRPTVHRYMNRELVLLTVVRRRKLNYCNGHAHKIFPNLLQQNFTAEEINYKWYTDFTYLFLSNGSKRYKCTIIAFRDRSVVASITDKKITSDLAIRTL